MVEKARVTAPNKVTFYNRHGKAVMPVYGHRSFYGPGSDCLTIIDHQTGERRQPILQDVNEAMIVADALENIDFVMNMFLPADVPQGVAGHYQMAAMLRHTVKPVFYVTTDFAGSVDVVAMAPDFVHYLDLPIFTLAGCSDSKVVDQQPGIEAALTLITDALCGAYIVHDLGYLESGLTRSLAQLVICDEILSRLSRFIRGADVGDTALALDLIDEIGPDGNFLESDHTFEHFRWRWNPGLFECDNYEGWLARGRQTLAERASARVEEIGLITNQILCPKTKFNNLRLLSSRQRGHRPLLGNRGGFLSPEEITTSHEASIDLLSTVGVAVHSDEAIAIFEEQGLRVDGRMVYLQEARTVTGCRHAFWQPTLSDRNGLERWLADGQPDAIQRASQLWKALLTKHADPPVDATTKRQLQAYLAERGG